MPDCSVSGCGKEAQLRGRLCSMHYKREKRGTDLQQEPQERLAPWARVLNAAFDLYDADSQDDAAYDRQEAKLRMAIVRWVRKQGWVSPAATEQLANSVQRAVQASVRGTGQQESSAQERTGAAIHQGRLGKSRRDARVGEADARAGGKSRAGGDRAPGAADAAAEVAERRAVRGGSAARPGGAEAVLPRAAQAGRRR